jgi:murein DD-endopeptidase MepM/ murein hydrolase activator NlpD
MRTARVVLVGGLLAALALPGAAHAGKWGESSPLGKRALAPGMRGKDVRLLQQGITILGITTTKTGRYSRGTYRTMRALERQSGWSPDGRMSRKEGKRIKKRVRAQLRRPRTSGPYVFPTGDPHDFGGSGSRFGAPRGDHAHQGQDIAAPCGLPVYSAGAGTLEVSAYQASGAGYYVVVDGADGTDTVYMHLQQRSPVLEGTALSPRAQIGNVGATGSATGCHLHFEHWSAPGWYEGGSPFDPLPELQYWDSYS